MGVAPTIGGRNGEILLPRTMGLQAWTHHPSIAAAAGTQANTHLGAVYLEIGQVITYLSVPITVAGSGLTMGALGIYDQNLNLVATTPNSPAAFQTTGWVEVALTAPWTVPATGFYYLGSGWLGTTLPTVLNVTQNSTVTNPMPGGFRIGVHAQVPVGTALPNPAVPAGTFVNAPLILAR